MDTYFKESPSVKHSRKKVTIIVLCALLVAAAGAAYVLIFDFQPKLEIVQLNMREHEDAVFGQRNVRLMRFAATAHYGDIELGGLAVTAVRGELPLFDNFKLWIDEKKDDSYLPSLYESHPKWHMNYVEISAPTGEGFIIKKGETVHFEVRGDSIRHAHRQFGDMIAIAFKAEQDFKYVEAQADKSGIGLLGLHTSDYGGKTVTDGTCESTCEIVVRTAIPKIVNLVDSICGNGMREGGEQCDDGNVVTGDGCSSMCKDETPVTVDIDHRFRQSISQLDIVVESATKSHRINNADIDQTDGKVYVTFDMEADSSYVDVFEIIWFSNLVSLEMNDGEEVQARGYFLVGKNGDPLSDYKDFSKVDSETDNDLFEDGAVEDFVVVFDVREDQFPVEIEFEDGYTLVEGFEPDNPSVQSSGEDDGSVIDDYVETKRAVSEPGDVKSIVAE